MTTLPIGRRDLRRLASAVVTAGLLPPTRLRARSDHSFRQGRFHVTVLSDGYISLPGDIVAPDAAPAERAEILRRLGSRDGIHRACANIPLIRTGDDLILVDIGSGHRYEPSDGRLAGNLAAAGIDPASITKVVFTHAHPDHIWATVTEEGRLRFPNATYFVGAAEWDFWMDPGYRARLPAALHGFAEGAQRDLGAIRDRVVMLKPGDDIVTGLRVFDTAGHTPGHLSLEMAGDDGLIITADAATNEVVSFEHAGSRFGYDMLPEVAIRNRIRLIDRAATDRVKLLGYHWAYPGLGFAERAGTAWRFVAAA